MLFFYYLRKFWSEVLVSIAILGILWLLIFYWYPHYLMNLFIHHNPTSDLSHEAEGYGRGTFGDMYGALNTFLSGLAFLGAVIAILLQVYQINQEKLKQDDEIIIKLNLFKWHLKKLQQEYLPHLILKVNPRKEGHIYPTEPVDFNDDYPFREILKMSILDLYKGLVSLKKKELAKVREDFVEVNEFKTKSIVDIKKAKRDIESKFEKLNHVLITSQNTILVNLGEEILALGENYFYSNDFDNQINELLDSIPENTDYLKALATFLRLDGLIGFTKQDIIERSEEMLKLIESLINNIPDIGSIYND